MDCKTNNAAHQGIIGHIKKNQKCQEKNLTHLLQKKSAFFLLLDNITDPHNLGSCLRNADAAGVDAVIIPKHNSAPLNSFARKISCGASENIPLIKVTNLCKTLKILKENHIWIVGTTTCKNDPILYKGELSKGAIALIVGSEEKGMRQSTKKYCNELITIPMLGTIPALNVSVASGICLFEIVRRRHFS